MAKITRLDANVLAFASQALASERTVFGAVTESDTLDANVTADFLRGWGIVGPNDEPTREDFNGLGFTLGQFIAYLHQVGVAEWNGNQEYHQNSLANESGVLYLCLTNNHTSVTAPSADAVNWSPLVTALKTPYDNSTSGLTAETVQAALDEVAGGQTPQTQTVWNTGTSTTESLISPLKLDTKIKTLAIGEGQTWQDLSASRSAGVTYTNTSGKSIEVSVNVGNAGDISLTVDGEIATSFNGTGQVQGHLICIVPNGATYLLTIPSGTLRYWKELR